MLIYVKWDVFIDISVGVVLVKLFVLVFGRYVFVRTLINGVWVKLEVSRFRGGGRFGGCCFWG